MKKMIVGYSREGLDTWQGLYIPMIAPRQDTVTSRLEFKDWITRSESHLDLAEYEIFVVSICKSTTVGTSVVEIQVNYL